MLSDGPEEGVHGVATGGREARRLFDLGESTGVTFTGFGKGPNAEARARDAYSTLCEQREQARAQSPARAPASPRKGSRVGPTKPPTKRYLVPRNHWPTYPCDEHDGRGWEVKLGLNLSAY